MPSAPLALWRPVTSNFERQLSSKVDGAAILNLDERVPSDDLKVVGKGSSEAVQAKNLLVFLVITFRMDEE